MGNKLEYTMLPWWDVMSAGRAVPVVLFLLVAWCLFAGLMKRYNSTLRRGHFSLLDNTMWPLLVNTVLYLVAFWYWAVPVAAGLGLIFESVIRNDLKRSLEDERQGMFGMNPHIKQLRGEAFNDLSVEEQMAYKEKVTPIAFSWWIHLLIVTVVPFLIVLLLEQLGLGNYLFRVYYY